MPRGPRGEKRPADVIGNAVKVMRIATGEEEDDFGKVDVTKDSSGEKGRAGGLKGGKIRAARLTPQRRTEIAKNAAKSRWKASAVEEE